MLTTDKFGEVAGHAVTAYTIENHNGVQLTVLDYGATWHALNVPTPDGSHQNLILNTDLAGYAKPDGYFGKAIGRFAGRVGAGQLVLDGQPVAVPANEGTTTLHGGPNGFSTLFFKAAAAADHVTFTRTVTPETDGFPGTLEVSVTYTLTEADEVVIDFTGATDQTTVFNPTNHVYWNLNSADDTIENHTLQLAATSHYELEPSKVLTGAVVANADTPYDFRGPRLLGPALRDLQVIPEAGLDDVFAIDDHAATEPVAVLSQGQRQVTMYSARNAVVVFTSNHFGDELHFLRHQSRPYVGIAMEAQTSAAGLVDPDLTQATLAAGTSRHEQIRYAFKY
ncbi:aldose epimerase family protein [Lacticaseibacillus suihuaensis]